MNMLQNFDKDNISDKTMQQISLIFQTNPNLNFDNVRMVSEAVSSVFSWVQAMYKYNEIMKKNTYLKKQKEQEKEEVKSKENDKS